MDWLWGRGVKSNSWVLSQVVFLPKLGSKDKSVGNSMNSILDLLMCCKRNYPVSINTRVWSQRGLDTCHISASHWWTGCLLWEDRRTWERNSQHHCLQEDAPSEETTKEPAEKEEARRGGPMEMKTGNDHLFHFLMKMVFFCFWMYMVTTQLLIQNS